jgi:hypothetical protein
MQTEVMTRRLRMRRFIGASTLMLFALSAQAIGFGDLYGSFAGRFDTYGAGHEGQAKQLDEALLKVSEYMNRRMPESIDRDTRLDRVSAEPGPHFSYHYTLLARNSMDVDKSSFAIAIRKQLKNQLCDSTQIRSFFDHGITVSYMYQGKDGLPIGGAEFPPNSCNGAHEPATKP